VNSPLPRRAYTARDVLWAVAAIGVALSGLLLGVDSLNHSKWAPTHIAALGASLLASVLVAALARRLTPLFGALAYGAMMASSVFVFGLAIAVLKTRVFPADPDFRRVLLVSAVVLAVALPTVLTIRRRERARASAF
jgi:hypothetical protein